MSTPPQTPNPGNSDNSPNSLATFFATVMAVITSIQHEMGVMKGDIGKLKGDIGRLSAEVDGLKTRMDDRFEHVDKRFDKMDEQIRELRRGSRLNFVVLIIAALGGAPGIVSLFQALALTLSQ